MGTVNACTKDEIEAMIFQVDAKIKIKKIDLGNEIIPIEPAQHLTPGWYVAEIYTDLDGVKKAKIKEYR